MDFPMAGLYGIIQGLTEFLPVSSSGHLALIPQLFPIQDPGVTFDLSMHVGTALAVSFYFRADFFLMGRDFFTGLTFPQKRRGKYWFFAWNLIAATLITVILALPLKFYAETYGRDPTLIAFNLAFFGLLMGLSDLLKVRFPSNELHREKNGKKAVFIGFMQACALFPGVSRSGITITAARLMGLSRDESSRFSFMLSLPLIIGGFLLKTYEGIQRGFHFDIGVALFGLLVSFVVGYVAIHYFLKFIRRIGLWGFAIYRFFISGLIFWFVA